MVGMRITLSTLFLLLFLSLAVALPGGPAAAQGQIGDREEDGTVATPSGLPLPRFVSLRADQVNMRSGPGKRYPVVWIYSKRGIPVEVVAEYGHWRKIRDPEGSEGWVHQNMLSGSRALITTGKAHFLRADPDADGRPIAQINPGVIGRLLTCPRGVDYCRVDTGGYLGWLPRDAFWGVYREEYLE